MLYEFVRIDRYTEVYDTGKDVLVRCENVSLAIVPNHRLEQVDGNYPVSYKIIPSNTDDRIEALLKLLDKKDQKLEYEKTSYRFEQNKVANLQEQIEDLKKELAKTKKGGLSIIKNPGGELSKIENKKGFLSIFSGKNK